MGGGKFVFSTSHFFKIISPQYNLLQRSFYTRVKLSDIYFFCQQHSNAEKVSLGGKSGETDLILLHLGGGVLLPNFSLLWWEMELFVLIKSYHFCYCPGCRLRRLPLPSSSLQGTMMALSPPPHLCLHLSLLPSLLSSPRTREDMSLFLRIDFPGSGFLSSY